MAGERFDLLVETAGPFFERVVLDKDSANLFDLRAGGWRHEQRGERSVVSMKLLLHLRAPQSLPNLRKKNPLLDTDVAQKASPKLGVLFLLDRSVVAKCAGEQGIEPRVIARKKLVQAARHQRMILRRRGGDAARVTAISSHCAQSHLGGI